MVVERAGTAKSAIAGHRVGVCERQRGSLGDEVGLLGVRFPSSASTVAPPRCSAVFPTRPRPGVPGLPSSFRRSKPPVIGREVFLCPGRRSRFSESAHP